MLKLFSGLKIKKEGKEINLDDVRVVTDLDRLVEDRIAFKLNGKTHLIKTVSVELLLKVTNENAKLQTLRGVEGIDQKMIYDAYAKIFGTMCDTITIHDVREMSQMQIAVLFRTIVNCITGKYSEPEKKTLKAQEPMMDLTQSS